MIKYTNYVPTHYYVYQFIVDGVPRYIGKGYKDRMFQHADYCRGGNTPWLKYLRNSISEKRHIEVVVVVDNLTSDEAFAIERSEIIRYGRTVFDEGPLLNMVTGGNGFDSESSKFNHSRPEVKRRHSEALRKAMTPEKRKSQGVKSKLSWERQDVRERRLAGLRENAAKEEYRQKLSDRLKEVCSDPEVRKKREEQLRLLREDPAVQAKISAGVKAAYKRPGMKEKISEIRKEVNSRPEVKAAKSRAAKLRKEVATALGKRYHDVTREDVDKYLTSQKDATITSVDG